MEEKGGKTEKSFRRGKASPPPPRVLPSLNWTETTRWRFGWPIHIFCTTITTTSIVSCSRPMNGRVFCADSTNFHNGPTTNIIIPNLVSPVCVSPAGPGATISSSSSFSRRAELPRNETRARKPFLPSFQVKKKPSRVAKVQKKKCPECDFHPFSLNKVCVCLRSNSTVA